MKWLTRSFVALTLVCALATPATAQESQAPEAPMTELTELTEPTEPTEPVAVPLAGVPIDYVAATRYALRLLDNTGDGRAVLLAVMGPNRYAHLAPKLNGESGWNCGINNPRSSAAGLGQTLDNPRRRAFLASHWLGPFTWAEVRGPSCLADAVLIDRLYELCGLGDWTPPYRCLTPRPR